MAKATCQACNRTVLLVTIGGEQVATDPELISVIGATQRLDSGDGGPRLRMATATALARRVHAERCEDYQNQARRERLSAEMKQFTANQQASKNNKKNRGL